MGIIDEDIQRVRDATDLVAVASEHAQLKKVGRRWVGLCPFHGEKTASFSVNAEQGLYYCFGCGAKGDAITFVRESEHVDFVGAVERLAARAGITLRYTDRAEGEGRKRRARLTEALRAAVGFYHERLLVAPDAAKARGYLRSRGLSGDDVRAYAIGWAPAGWDALARHLRVPDDVFTEAGLGYVNATGRQTDAFRRRVLFPIFDPAGDPVGFGGRILPGEDGPKYKNSAESAVYAKSRVLYGLNWAKADVVRADEVIVCEGYTDVIGFAAAGLPRAVATCGTSLTDEHVRLLRSYASRVVLAFDADAAGQTAAERFYEWERSLGIEVAVADLPEGRDPADVARDDPQRLRAAVDKAHPYLRFRLERVLGAARLTTPEGRAAAVDAALPLIREHPNPLVRDQYLMEVADRCRIEPEALRRLLAEGGRAVRGRQVRPDVRARAAPDDGAEYEALRLLLAEGCEDHGIASWLEAVLFYDPRAREVYEALVRSGGDVRAAAGMVDDESADLLARLAVTDTDADPEDVVGLLVSAAIGRAMTDLERRARHDDDPLAVARDMAWLKLRQEELTERATRESAIEQLLAWLTDEPEENP